MKDLTAQDLIDLYANGMISRDEGRRRAGFLTDRGEVRSGTGRWQAGDIIYDRSHLGSLPPGTVVENNNGYELIVLNKRTVYKVAGEVIQKIAARDGYPPYRIIYIGSGS